MKLRRSALACSLVGLTLIACGARGNLDDYSPGDGPTVDSGAANKTPTPGASSTATPGSPGTPGSSPGSPGTSDEDAGGNPGTTTPGLPGLGTDSGLVDCGTCVASQCTSQIETCLADTTCSTALQCIATTCLGGALGGLGGLGGSSGSGSSSGSSSGGTGASCFLTCGGGSITGLTSLLPILTCITGTCGSGCGSLLGGLGGLGGLVRVKTLPEGDAPPAENAGRRIFSAYPQICGAN